MMLIVTFTLFFAAEAGSAADFLGRPAPSLPNQSLPTEQIAHSTESVIMAPANGLEIVSRSSQPQAQESEVTARLFGDSKSKSPKRIRSCAFDLRQEMIPPGSYAIEDDILLLFRPGVDEADEVCTTSAGIKAPASDVKTVRCLADHLSDQNPDTHAKLLFVVTIAAGTITKVSDTRHELSFRVDDLSTALAFTDRPQRWAFDLTLPMLLAMWGEGSDSFVADPPNAAIEDSRFKVGVTEITGLRADGETVTFQLDNMASRSLDESHHLVHDVGHLSLFIDSSIVTAAGVSVLLRGAAKACVATECYLWPLGA